MTEKPPQPLIPLREGINFRAETCDHLFCQCGHPIATSPEVPNVSPALFPFLEVGETLAQQTVTTSRPKTR